jgi:hypothetical protein
MDWRPLLARYVWAVAVREALGSRRWSAETKILVLMTLVPALAFFGLLMELWWVLTGRGGRLRHILAQDVVVAIPFSNRVPARFAEQRAEMRPDQSSKTCNVMPRRSAS